MTTNRTSQHAEYLLDCGHMDIDMWNSGRPGERQSFPRRLNAIAEKYKRMEEAHQHIHHDDCHPSRYEEGTTECNAKRNRDDSHVCPYIWSEEVLAFDPLDS